jgi:hypothetical protein
MFDECQLLANLNLNHNSHILCQSLNILLRPQVASVMAHYHYRNCGMKVLSLRQMTLA